MVLYLGLCCLTQIFVICFLRTIVLILQVLLIIPLLTNVDLHLMKSLLLLLKMNWFLQVSLFLNRVIPASVNYYLLLMRYIVPLKVLKLEASSLISQRHLIKVWNDGMIFKLPQNGISGYLLNVLRDFFNEWKQGTLGVATIAMICSTLASL